MGLRYMLKNNSSPYCYRNFNPKSYATKTRAEIKRLKTELTLTDYQVIKSYEYALADQPSPYDISHSMRQQLMEQIRDLEKTL